MRTIESLVPTLIEKTNNGSLSWTKMKPPSTGFRAGIGKYFVQVWEWTEADSETEGITVGINDSSDVQIDHLIVDQYSSRHNTFQELYMAARRNALGLDEALDEIASELEKLFPL